MELSESIKDYKYEVAFSFLKEVLELAQSLSDRLSDRLPTFIYTDRQNDVVATEAMESFRRVYGGEARIVVILYRPKWGQTPYTRIEQDAIQSRSFKNGQDFILLIQLEPGKPEWYSESRIYADINRSSLDVIIGHIEHMVQTRGGQVRVESLEDHAARLKREKDRLVRFDQFYNSREGTMAALAEFNALCILCRARRKVLSPLLNANSSEASLDGKYYMATIGDVALSFNWTHQFVNSLMDARLIVELSNGERFRNGARMSDHKVHAKHEYLFAQGPSGTYGWQDHQRTQPIRTNEVLLELWIKQGMDIAHQLEEKEINKRIR